MITKLHYTEQPCTPDVTHHSPAQIKLLTSLHTPLAMSRTHVSYRIPLIHHHHLPPADLEGALTQPYNMQRGYVIAVVLEL